MASATKHSRGRLDDGAPNPIDVHVGGRVRLRRTLLGMTQEQLGEAIGLTFQQVQKYERGANRVGASRLFDLSRVLEIPVSFFFDDLKDEAKASSPAAVIKGEAGHLSAAPAADPDSMCRRETLELVRAYYNIEDPQVRRRVYELAKALGGKPE
jgi:transcriptional regulator with XRE-family HTH domain